MAGPCRICPNCGQRKPLFQLQASDSAMIIPPKIAMHKPATAARVMRSSRRKGESSATQSGPVDTNTTELATVVYSREEIQVAKCTARKSPANIPGRYSLRVRLFSSARWRSRAKGAKSSVANVSRKAAITREGASSCAKRMKIEEVETAKIAVSNARGSLKRGRVAGIRPFYRTSDLHARRSPVF